MQVLDCESIREYVRLKGVELTEDQFDFICTEEARPALVEIRWTHMRVKSHRPGHDHRRR